MPDPSDPTDTETAAGERCNTCHDTGVQPDFSPNPDFQPCSDCSLPAPVREPDEAAAEVDVRSIETVAKIIGANDGVTDWELIPLEAILAYRSTAKLVMTAVLASDWLAEYTAKARARTLRLAANEVSERSSRMPQDQRPSAEMITGWLNERADRIDGGAR